ncbi:cell division protein PerM [Agromyces neolithicus]|uniref:Integral membrane protein n=1 Tax=Agromyces neolithicus TaxID=269420 RepID=A0ABN2M5I7_9MICO
MRRTTIALLAALEAAVAALIGLGIALVPLMLLWAVQYGLTVDVTVFLRAAADVWLLGHGVDLTVQLDPITAGGLGLPGADQPFAITIALLGFALLSVAAGRRIGRRSAAGGHSITGAVAAVVVYAAVGATLAIVAGADVARASIWQATLLPAVTVTIGVAIGAVAETLREPSPTDAAGGFFRERLGDLPRGVLDAITAAVRIGAGAAFALLAVAAGLLAVLIALDYTTIAGLSQSLGAGVDGGIALLVGELAFLPNLVVWLAAWMLGPGFALGTGTVVAPGGTLLGPVPGIPLLGAIPAAAPLVGVLWLLVPVLAAFIGAWLVQGDVRDGWPGAGPASPGAAVPWWRPIAVGAGAAAVAGVVLGLLAWWSGGAAGPGRLADVGPDAWVVAGVAAATVGVGSIAGGLTARMQTRAPTTGRTSATPDRSSGLPSTGSGNGNR